jgi:hypothetical protein
MAVYYRQLVDGIQIDTDTVIKPHFDGQTDVELLAAKAKGAADKEWAVEWTGGTSFSARKIRWEGNDVVREFWVG